MKKILRLFILSLIIVGCSEEFLDTSLEGTTTDLDIAQLAQESPEQLLTVASSFDKGTINNMRTFGVGGTTQPAHFDYGQKSVDLAMDLMGNDMINDGNGWWYEDYYNFTGRILNKLETSVIWNYYYEIIKGANQTISLIGGLDTSQLNDDLNYVLARSKIVRGISYLQLIQIYQKGLPSLSDAGVPIIDPTADLINGPGFGRLTVEDIYTQIELDLSEGYENITGYARADKTSINKFVAAGFLARYYLLIQDYPKAISFAQEAQGGASLNATSLLDGFQYISNSEWMWGADLDADTNTTYASFFAQMQSYSPVFYAGNGYTPGYTGQLGHHKIVDKRLYDDISKTDIRKNWFGPDNGAIYNGSPDKLYNYKFYDNTFFEADYVYMRVAEMYLIEAEAQALNSNDSGAAMVLFNLISTRDNAYSMSTNTGPALMDEIKLHRRIELWGEGFGMLDLKRWNDPIVRVYSGSSHPIGPGLFDLAAGSPFFTFQIPEGEINSNDAISVDDQNP